MGELECDACHNKLSPFQRIQLCRVLGASTIGANQGRRSGVHRAFVLHGPHDRDSVDVETTQECDEGSEERKFGATPLAGPSLTLRHCSRFPYIPRSLSCSSS